MKHNKKMVLVPEEVLNLIQQKAELQTSPLVKSMSSLNRQMGQTLEDSNLSNDVKLKNHEQLFQRFLNLQEQRESFVPTVKLQSTSTQETPTQPQETTPSVSDSEILGTVPKKFKSQAEGLLQWMKRSPETIRWDGKGVVSLEGKPIHGSSITDLVNDVLRTRKGFSPTGRDDFTKVLAKLNTPEDFVRNEERRKVLSTYKSKTRLLPSTPKDATSLFPTPPTRPRKRLVSPGLQARRLKVQGKKTLDWVSPYK